jgi:hypothetical protein
MELRIRINLDNQAFSEGDMGVQAANILREAADRMQVRGIYLGYVMSLYDTNGGWVGIATVIDEKEESDDGR